MLQFQVDAFYNVNVWVKINYVNFTRGQDKIAD